MLAKSIRRVFLGLGLLAATGSTAQPTNHAPAPAAGLEFIANQGQWPDAVHYAAPLTQGRLFLEAQGWTYALTEPVHPHPEAPANPEKLRAHAVRMQFVAASPAALQAAAPTGEVRNYLLGNDPSHWATGVKSYQELRYPHLWPGIDAKLYENRDHHLEYDFEVAAGADASQIRQRYSGAEQLRLTAEGALQIGTSVGQFTELAPQAWQLDAQGHRQPVPCRYVLDGTEVGFRLGAYDHARPLVIDPTVVFSTFSGSAADNWGFTATYDPQGNLYSGGIAFGLGYPASPGAYNTSFSGNIDIAIIKYNTAASGPAARIWATYLGGSNGEYPQSLVVNNQGQLLILGTTGSSNYPTSATGYDRTFAGGPAVNPYSTSITDPTYTLFNGTDLVVTRLAANGATLAGSTFLGGSGTEGLMPHGGASLDLVRNYGDQFRGDILVDAVDNVYIASNTTSTDYPVRNSFQPTRGTGIEAVVSKLSPDLSALTWSSYLGGNGTDAAYSLQLDAQGRLFVCGGTQSSNFPVTAGALKPSYGGLVDGFVARISATGLGLERATYLGTSSYDQAYFVQLDSGGDPYLLGQTLGTYPTTLGRFFTPGGRQFIHKLNADLTTTDFATIFGSGRNTIDISPTAFLVDQCGRIYVSGWGGGTNVSYGNGTMQGMPLAGTSQQTTTDGADFYLMQLGTDATVLEYATYFGGTGQDHVDGGTSRFDRRGLVYQAVCGGCGGSSSFPIPPGAGYYSTTNFSTNCNNAAFKFDFEPQRAVVGPSRTVCQTAGPVTLTASPAGGVWAGPGVTGTVSTGYVFTPATQSLGAVTLTYTVSTGLCQSQSTLQVTVVAPPTVTFPPLSPNSFCATSPAVTLAAQPAGGTFSGPGVSNGGFFPVSAGPGTHTLTYTYTTGGCTATATQQVTVVVANAGPALSLCTPVAAQPLTGTPTGGIWSGPFVTGTQATGFQFAPTGAASGTYTLTYSVTAPSGCVSTSTRQVFLTPQPVVALPSPTQFCVGSTTPVPLGNTAVWAGRGIQFTSGGYTFTPSLAGVGQHTISYVATRGSCETRGTVVMSVGNPPVVTVPADTTLCPGATQAFRLRGQPAGGTWSGPNVTAAGVFTPPAGFSGAASLLYSINSLGCVATATRRVVVAVPPAFAPTWTPAFCAEDRAAPLRVRFSGAVAADATWDFGDGTTGSGQTVEHTYTEARQYQPSVTVRYNDGRCQQVIRLAPIDVVASPQIPNIITPNGDEQNDTFWASNGCPPRLQVFSRWGNQVYEAATYANDWSGGTQPAGVYYYLLRFPDGRTVKGWLEIVR